MSIFPVGAKVTGDVGSFVTAMASGAKSLGAFAGAAGLAGGALGALAGAAAMGAAIGAAKDYQKELVKLNTLVGISVQEIEAWDDQMRQIAVTTGQSATDVAKAMFAITSGGARGSEAIELLEISAKAAAIGLGDMTALGRTAGAMLQAFGDEGLTASAAMDVLVATVREGNLEASSLAAAFARVLGPAKTLGSSVQDVGAFLATFTRLGGSTEEAATGLLNVFNLMIKPIDAQREAMEKYGISVERLRGLIKKDGLQAALQALVEGLEGNIDAFGEVLPNVRQLIGVLNTAGLQSEEYARIQVSLQESMGDTARSFETWGDSADATFERFKSTIGEVAIEVGEALLPALSTLLEALSPVIKAFGFLVNEVDEFVRAIGAELDGPLQRLIDRLMLLKPNMDSATQSLFDFNQEREKLGLDEVDITPFQALRNELRGMSDEDLTGHIDSLRLSINALTPDTEGYSNAALNARRVQRLLATEIVATGSELQRRAVVERDLGDAIEETEVITKSMVLTEEQRREKAAEILAGLQSEIDALTMSERQLILRTAAQLDDTGALSVSVEAGLDSIDSLEAQAAATKEASEAQANAASEREAMIQGLQREIDMLGIGADAIELRRAAEIDALQALGIAQALATGEITETVAAQMREGASLVEIIELLHEKRDALQDERDAEKETQRAIDKAIKARERETETLARNRAKAIRDLVKAAEKTRANLELAKIQDDIRQTTELAQSWAESMGAAFESIIDGTKSVSDAFGDMITEILKELQRLAIQKKIIDPIAEALFGALTGGASTPSIDPADVTAGVADLGDQLARKGIDVSGRGLQGISLPSVTSPSGFKGTFVGGGVPSVVVEQTIIFENQFIDGADGDRWLRQNEATIMRIVAQGAQRSSDYARVLRGGLPS